MPSTEGAPAPGDRRIGSRRRAIVIALSLVTLAGLVAAGAVVEHARRHPEAFRTYDSGWTTGYPHSAIDQTHYVGMSYAPKDEHGQVTIREVKAHGVDDTADASLKFFVCTLKGDIGGIGMGRDEDVQRFCSLLVPAAGARLELNGTPRQQLLISITLRKPGRAKVHGVDLTYSYGWRSGNQHIGGNAILRVPPRA
jgi:hypothetical protein